MAAKHILIVDDEAPMRRLLRRCLETEGYEISEAANGLQVQAALKRTKFDLITLDLRLGDQNGFDLLRQIRTSTEAAVVMITGKDDLIDKVLGLELGADDYITKPFHVREVQARIMAALRRRSTPDLPVGQGSGAVYRFEGWSLDTGKVELTDPQQAICDLTTADFKLLCVFVQHPRRVLSREQLMDLTGGLEWAPLDRTIDNQVARLRRKIEVEPGDPRLIKTVRGIGYLFAPDVEVVLSSTSS